MKLPRKALPLLSTALLAVGAVACSSQTSGTSATTATTAATAGSSTSTAASTASSPSANAVLANQVQGRGGSVSPSSVTTVAQLNALVQEAYGDASLGLHRGHQPVESTLIEVLGITHEEMHVRMDAGQNLAAVATDLGIDPQTLIDALVDSWSPAIDNLQAAGTITSSQADAYRAALREAFTFKVTWDGQAATPTFTGV